MLRFSGEELANLIPLTAEIYTVDGVDKGVIMKPDELREFGENYFNAALNKSVFPQLFIRKKE